MKKFASWAAGVEVRGARGASINLNNSSFQRRLESSPSYFQALGRTGSQPVRWDDGVIIYPATKYGEVVVPAKAGTQRLCDVRHWIPAFAGTTKSSKSFQHVYLPDQ